MGEVRVVTRPTKEGEERRQSRSTNAIVFRHSTVKERKEEEVGENDPKVRCIRFRYDR